MALDSTVVVEAIAELLKFINKTIDNAQEKKKIKKEEADALRKDLEAAVKRRHYSRIFAIARRVREL